MNRRYRVRWWTGPTRVDDYVVRVNAIPGFTDVIGGTEHVYFTLDARDEYYARMQVEDAIGKSFCRVEAL